MALVSHSVHRIIDYRTHIYTSRQKARGLNIVRRRPQLTTPPQKKTQERESKQTNTHIRQPVDTASEDNINRRRCRLIIKVEDERSRS